MLKKGVLLVILSSVLFVSCNPSSPPSEQASQNPAPSQDSTDKQAEMTYTITDSNYSYQGTTMTYPQIDTTDAKKSRINQLIRSEALKGLAYYSGSESDLTLDIKYEIKHKGSRFLSIQYTGVGYVQGAAYPNNRFYTTTINLETVEKVRLQDLVKIDQKFLETFQKAQWKPVRPELEELGLLQTYTADDLKKMLAEADTFGTSDVYSYLTKDALGISISVPHAVGDHAEFEINYKDLGTNLAQ